jgi:hypothetical protein
MTVSWRRSAPSCAGGEAAGGHDLGGLPDARAGAREASCADFGVAVWDFGTLTQNQSSLEPSLGFAAIAGTPRIVDRARYVQALPRAR